MGRCRARGDSIYKGRLFTLRDTEEIESEAWTRTTLKGHYYSEMKPPPPNILDQSGMMVDVLRVIMRRAIDES